MPSLWGLVCRQWQYTCCSIDSLHAINYRQVTKIRREYIPFFNLSMASCLCLSFSLSSFNLRSSSSFSFFFFSMSFCLSFSLSMPSFRSDSSFSFRFLSLSSSSFFFCCHSFSVFSLSSLIRSLENNKSMYSMSLHIHAVMFKKNK